MIENTEIISGQLPFSDCEGNPIKVGSIIEQTNYNGEKYTARYRVVVDPSDNQVCLLMISGNAKAMKNKGYSAFGSIINGKLCKGRVVRI